MSEIRNLECDQPPVGAGERVEFNFQMIQRGDIIKPGWWHWRCRREDSSGDVAYGYVHADPLGLAILPETFEMDRR